MTVSVHQAGDKWNLEAYDETTELPYPEDFSEFSTFLNRALEYLELAQDGSSASREEFWSSGKKVYQGYRDVYLTLMSPGTRYVEYLDRTEPSTKADAQVRALLDVILGLVLGFTKQDDVAWVDLTPQSGWPVAAATPQQLPPSFRRRRLAIGQTSLSIRSDAFSMDTQSMKNILHHGQGAHGQGKLSMPTVPKNEQFLAALRTLSILPPPFRPYSAGSMIAPQP
ncbi:hypothetical protein GB937_007210 [Aspergillus fischeri]|nr:hypothetical protein GB937_007210 [Aspergillus fischeri]